MCELRAPHSMFPSYSHRKGVHKVVGLCLQNERSESVSVSFEDACGEMRRRVWCSCTTRLRSCCLDPGHRPLFYYRLRLPPSRLPRHSCVMCCWSGSGTSPSSISPPHLQDDVPFSVVSPCHCGCRRLGHNSAGCSQR
jgi:hypothetical protein